MTNYICKLIQRRDDLRKEVKNLPVSDNFRKCYVRFINKLKKLTDSRTGKTLHDAYKFEANMCLT